MHSLSVFYFSSVVTGDPVWFSKYIIGYDCKSISYIDWQWNNCISIESEFEVTTAFELIFSIDASIDIDTHTHTEKNQMGRNNKSSVNLMNHLATFCEYSILLLYF